MINKVILVGRLGKDPEMRYTTSGKAVCGFSLATDDGYGENRRTEWHNIVLWEKTAEVASRYLSKGSLVYIEGRLQTQKYEDKDGITRYRTEIVGRVMKMLDSKGNAGVTPPIPPSEDEDVFTPPPMAGPAGTEDDIPF